MASLWALISGSSNSICGHRVRRAGVTRIAGTTVGNPVKVEPDLSFDSLIPLSAILPGEIMHQD